MHLTNDLEPEQVLELPSHYLFDPGLLRQNYRTVLPQTFRIATDGSLETLDADAFRNGDLVSLFFTFRTFVSPPTWNSVGLFVMASITLRSVVLLTPGNNVSSTFLVPKTFMLIFL